MAVVDTQNLKAHFDKSINDVATGLNNTLFLQGLDRLEFHGELTGTLSEFQKRFEEVKAAGDKIYEKITSIKKTGKETNELVEAIHMFQATIEFVDSIDEALDSIFAAVLAGRRDEPFAVATHSLISAATILKGGSAAMLMVGPEFLPIAVGGHIIGAVIDILAKLLEFFGPKEETMLDKFEKLLRQIGGETAFHELRSSLESIKGLLAEFRTANGMWVDSSWKEYDDKMTATLGMARDRLGKNASWLLEKKNQSALEQWTAVLDVFIECHAELAIVMSLTYGRAAQRALRIQGELAPQALKALIAEQLTAIDKAKLHYDTLRQHLDKLAWLARNTSRLFSIGDDEKLYTTLGCIVERREKNWSAGKLGGEHDDFIVLEATDMEEIPEVLAWHRNGSDCEIFLPAKERGSSPGRWAKVEIDAKSFPANFPELANRSVDVTRLSDVDRGNDVTPSRHPTLTVPCDDVLFVVTSLLSDNDFIIRSVTYKRYGEKLVVDEFKSLSYRKSPETEVDGVVRGFSTAELPMKRELGIAFLAKNKCVYVTRNLADGNSFVQVGLPVDWCKKVFARDGKIWAMGEKRVAWVAFDAKPDAKWNDVSPDPADLGLTGNWFFVDLEPPGETGLMVGALKHQLLFWTAETRWKKGNETEYETFTVAKHSPDPACLELFALRGLAREYVKMLDTKATIPLGRIGQRLKVATTESGTAA